MKINNNNAADLGESKKGQIWVFENEPRLGVQQIEERKNAAGKDSKRGIWWKIGGDEDGHEHEVGPTSVLPDPHQTLSLSPPFLSLFSLPLKEKNPNSK